MGDSQKGVQNDAVASRWSHEQTHEKSNSNSVPVPVYIPGPPGGWVNINQGPNPHKNAAQNALARAPISAATAPLVSQTGLNGSHAGADSIKPICGTRGAAGKKLDFASIGCPKRFFAAAARPLRPKISEMPDVVAGKTPPGERMGASSPLGFWIRTGAPGQVPSHVARCGPGPRQWPVRPPPLPLYKILR